MKKNFLLIIAFLISFASIGQSKDVDAVKEVLNNYKKSIEKLDTTGIPALFVSDSKVFEQAKDEGTIRDYLGHHLGPELKAFKSFSFSDYKVDVTIAGDHAFSSESYLYRIVLAKDGTEIKSQGVATSVLRKTSQGWKIVMTHSSFRRTK